MLDTPTYSTYKQETIPTSVHVFIPLNTTWRQIPSDWMMSLGKLEYANKLFLMLYFFPK